MPPPRRRCIAAPARALRVALAALLLGVVAGVAPAITVKLGSLAPSGSPWDDTLRDLAGAWQRLSSGVVDLKIFPGGIVGDEAAMLRRMRIGQLQAAAITGGGLSQIYRGALTLSWPMLIRTDAELAFVMERTTPIIEAELERRGFKVLMWSPAGWLRFFGRTPVGTIDELRRQRLWIFDASPPVVRAWQDAGFSVVPLDVTEVTTALQSGMIDAYIASALSAAAFQWFGITPHMNEMRFAPLVGAVVMSNRAWDGIPAELRPALLQAARQEAAELTAITGAAEEQAIAVMQRFGLQVHPASDEFVHRWERIVDRGFQSIIGEVIDPATYQLISGQLEEFRARR